MSNANRQTNYSSSCTIEIPAGERSRLIQLARVHFGYEDLYDHQLNAAYAMLNGIDSSVIVGTGSGKSLCYALAALGAKHQQLKKMVIVVSPLIALMKDQVSIYSLLPFLNDELPISLQIHILV
jgi:superfamily II DNA helicase RecQ